MIIRKVKKNNMKTLVIKRDGSEESFDKHKIVRVTKAAGLSEEEAVALADRVAAWIKRTVKEKIASRQIRDRVVEELNAVDKYAADMYIWYEGVKERDHLKKVYGKDFQ